MLFFLCLGTKTLQSNFFALIHTASSLIYTQIIRETALFRKTRESSRNILSLNEAAFLRACSPPRGQKAFDSPGSWSPHSTATAKILWEISHSLHTDVWKPQMARPNLFLTILFGAHMTTIYQVQITDLETISVEHRADLQHGSVRLATDRIF